MEAEVQTTSTISQKFSRYRSVRIAALKEVPITSVPALPSQTGGDRARHEPSRYKHKKPPTSGVPGLSHHVGLSQREEFSVNAFGLNAEGCGSLEGSTTPDAYRARHLDTRYSNGPRGHSEVSPFSKRRDYGVCKLSGPVDDLHTAGFNDAELQDIYLREGSEERVARRGFDDAHREAYAILNGEVNRERRLRQLHRECGQRTIQSTRNRMDEKVNLQRPISEKKLGRTRNNHQEFSTAHTGAKVATQKTDQTPSSTSERSMVRRNLPGIDAPVSAINTGERNVRVKFIKSSIVVPVTTATTVDDVLQSTAESFPESFDAGSAVLIESFKLLGLERPLRRYEHVRDILNSWDHDEQNSLLVVQSFTGLGVNGLGIVSVPPRQPEAASVSIYHSQKPGIWDKRQITLREDGQVILTKPSGETTNICHMSDFDVYTPTHRQLKKLSPPKTQCFAIKSQQKSAMFLTTANFVHFFSTKDKVVAETWHEAVQNWRSRYLVHVMGNGQQKVVPKSAPTHSADKALCVIKPLKHEKKTSKTFPSRPVCTSIPAETMNEFLIDSPSKPVAAVTDSPALKSVDIILRTRPFRKYAPPPASNPKHFATISDTEPLAKFVQAVSSHALPTQEETTLLSGRVGKQPNQRFGAPHIQLPRTTPLTQSNKLVRSTSQRHKPAPLKPGQLTSAPPHKPLIDLSPQFQEPPQYFKRGRGVTISQIPVGGLVNIATSPEVALPLPSTTMLQRPRTGYNNETGTQRTMATRAPAPHATGPLPSSEKQELAFLMGGLLAQAECRREGRKSAAGAKSRDRDSTEPMVDVAESSIYVPGSLLADVEKQVGRSNGPTIDREKKMEVMTSTGECV
ncbi:hypothetical protein MMC34_004879 [Xylographa carneopallida]|nr:hypothetical protein [Xylographa carneopallida]